MSSVGISIGVVGYKSSSKFKERNFDKAKKARKSFRAEASSLKLKIETAESLPVSGIRVEMRIIESREK